MINTHYKNLGGSSNVEWYRYGDDFIEVKFFGTLKIYKYTYRSAGKTNIEEMKRLAAKGIGLNSYINRKCRLLYENFC